jgi:hypothetical protein
MASKRRGMLAFGNDDKKLCEDASECVCLLLLLSIHPSNVIYHYYLFIQVEKNSLSLSFSLERHQAANVGWIFHRNNERRAPQEKKGSQAGTDWLG